MWHCLGADHEVLKDVDRSNRFSPMNHMNVYELRNAIEGF